MCTVQKDFMQGRGKKTKKGSGGDDDEGMVGVIDPAFLKGKVFDRCLRYMLLIPSQCLSLSRVRARSRSRTLSHSLPYTHSLSNTHTHTHTHTSTSVRTQHSTHSQKSLPTRIHSAAFPPTLVFSLFSSRSHKCAHSTALANIRRHS